MRKRESEPKRRAARSEIEDRRDMLAWTKAQASLRHHVRGEEAPSGSTLEAASAPERQVAAAVGLAAIRAAELTPHVLVQQAIEAAEHGETREITSLIAAGFSADPSTAQLIGIAVARWQQQRRAGTSSRAVECLRAVARGLRAQGSGRRPTGKRPLSPQELETYDAILVNCRCARAGRLSDRKLPATLPLPAHRRLQAYWESPKKRSPRDAALEVFSLAIGVSPTYARTLLAEAHRRGVR